MANVTVKDEGYVVDPTCLRATGRQAYFPSIVELSPGVWLASFDMGTTMEAPDVRTWLSRSHDGGRSWSTPGWILDTTDIGYPASTLGRISRLRDGSLLALLTVCDRSRTGSGLANPHTEGFVETRFATLISHDTGTSWQAFRWVDPPIPWNSFETCSPILEARDTRWLLPTSVWRRWDGDCAPGMKALVFVSTDRGTSWTGCTDVVNQWENHVASWEQKQTRLSDGRWLALCWAFSYATKTSLHNRYCFSDDDGSSYGTPCEAPIHGETCTPLALPDNHVVCAYRRVDKRGLWAHVARIQGTHWVPLADAPLWGMDQSSYGAWADSKVEEMSTLQFGYPQCTQLSDGTVLVVFWCVENAIACIRWVRMGISL